MGFQEDSSLGSLLNKIWGRNDPNVERTLTGDSTCFFFSSGQLHLSSLMRRELGNRRSCLFGVDNILKT